MHWNAGKEKRVSAKPDTTWLKDALGKRKGRTHQAVELYQQRYKDKIEERVKAEFNLHSAVTNKERMAIRHRVVSEMWKAEDETIITEITGEAEGEKQKRNEKKSEDGTEISNSVKARTPEEYDVFVTSCFCQYNCSIHRLQGYKITSLNSSISIPSDY